MLDTLLAQGILPDTVIRMGIRKLLRDHLAVLPVDQGPKTAAYVKDFIESLREQPIAVHTREANEQHYEVPTAFYQAVLGPHLKYSSGLWPDAPGDLLAGLPESERAMLALTCERAGLADGMDILELGCGWGSLTLYMAENFPQSRILAISNSSTQRAHIEAEAARRGLANVTIQTADMNVFDTPQRFDRVVSVEMFEHMRNYHALLARVTGFLKPEGRIFVHIFTHRQTPYLFVAKDASDWMARYFFSGGMMPVADMFSHFPDHVDVLQQWTVNGRHYALTSEAWLQKMDAQRTPLYPFFEQTYGTAEAGRWWNYWRIFFMSCAELFAYKQGSEWFVSHYLLAPRS
jgi:cyclopropane-fatty-acyl-phospholipid synthase